MRLGSQASRIEAGTLAHAIYGKDVIGERHRHRFEFNNAYRTPFQKQGMRFTGIWPIGNLVEIVELADHPWFVAVQFHPEFKSKPTAAHPLFKGFIAAALARKGKAETAPEAKPTPS
jgi:CTP synthase